MWTLASLTEFMKEVVLLPRTQPVDILQVFCMSVKIKIPKYGNKCKVSLNLIPGNEELT